MRIRIKTPDHQVFNHDVEKETITIGRASENDFVVPLADFSRKHCSITFKGEYAFIMDLGSKNGVMIDGKRIPPHQQFPIYIHTKVVLANHFEFILPDGTSIKEREDLELELEVPLKKNW